MPRPMLAVPASLVLLAGWIVEFFTACQALKKESKLAWVYAARVAMTTGGVYPGFAEHPLIPAIKCGLVRWSLRRTLTHGLPS